MRSRRIRRAPFGNCSQDPPRLRTTGPRDNPLSKDWVARGAVQQVGMSLYAVLLVLCSVFTWVAGVAVRTQVSDSVAGVLGQALGIALMLFFLLLGCAAAFVATRLIKGVSRSFHSRK